MAALTTDRTTKALSGTERAMRDFKVAAGETIYWGAMVGINSSGYAVPMTTATGLKCAGVSRKRVDNSGGADGDESVKVEESAAGWNMGTGADALDQSNIGDDVYASDDNTVNATDATGTRSKAGTLFYFDEEASVPYVLPAV